MNSEDSESRKLEPQSGQSDQEFEGNTMKPGLLNPFGHVDKKIEPRSLPTNEGDENTVKPGLLKPFGHVDKKIEPGSLPTNEGDENTVKPGLLKPFGHVDKKIEPGSLPTNEEDENTVKPGLLKPFGHVDKKIEPGSLPTNEEDENTVKPSPLKEQVQTGHRSQPDKIIEEDEEEEKDAVENPYRKLERAMKQLLDAINEEMSKHNGRSQILSSRSIIEESDLVRFISDAACYDDELKSYLRRAIDLSKTDNSESAAIYAANSITLLVAAHYSFSGQDLSNIKVKGSNLKNGIFSGTDFTQADLSYTDLRDIQAKNAKFKKTNLIGVKLGTLLGLQGHTAEVTSVSFSRDGNYVASGSWDNKVKIWEVQASKCVSTFEGHTGAVLGVSFSGDGKHVASGSKDKTVKIWDVASNLCISTLQGHTDIIRGVSFSEDGKYIASGSADKTVKIWEVQTNNCVHTLEGHTESVSRVSVSGDGRYVASASADKTVRIWEMETNKCLNTLAGHTEDVMDVSFSGDGKYVASSSWDKNVKIWDVATNKCVSTLQGHTDVVRGVSVSGDGRYVASASQDRTVKIWEVQTNKCVSTLQGHTHPVLSVSFSGDGSSIASASDDKTVIIWVKINDTWILDKIFTASEPPHNTHEAVLEEASLSIQNEKIFVQRGALTKKNNIVNDAASEVKQNLGNAQLTANMGSEELLKHRITKYKELAKQKLVKRDIPIENKKNCNEPEQEIELHNRLTKAHSKISTLELQLAQIKQENVELRKAVEKVPWIIETTERLKLELEKLRNENKVLAEKGFGNNSN